MSGRKRGKVSAADAGIAGAGNGTNTQQKEGKLRDTKEVTDKGDEDAAGADERSRREGMDGRSPAGGLKDFVKKMDKRSHRIVEMRLGLVGAFGVAFRLLLFDELGNRDLVTRSVFFFVIVVLIVLIFGAWLDYFPHWLSHLQLRPVEGQGIALGCLLVPTLCSAALHSALYTAPQVIDLLSLYLTAMATMSLLSVLSSILYLVSFPNNITLYNFAVIGVTFALYYWMKVPYWFLLPPLISYSLLLPWLLHTFPRSFSICEAMIVSQGLTLLIWDTTLQILVINDLVSLPKLFLVHRNQALLFVEFLVLGVILCCLLLSPALYKVLQARSYYDRKFWSGTFLLLSLSVGVVLILPWLQAAMGGLRTVHPIALVLTVTFTQPLQLGLMLYWLSITIATVVIVTAQSSQSAWLAPLKASNSSSLWMRKCFHISALLIFLPGLLLRPTYLALATSLIVFLFAGFELLRYCRMWPGGDTLHLHLLPLLDSRDSGPLLLSHSYLLLGLSLPLWITPLRAYNGITKLALYSGVLSLGVGDTVAAMAGQLLGKNKWPGTSKTVEGTAVSALAQLLAVLLIALIDPHLPLPCLRQWGIIAGSVVAAALMEAYTWQIDNLVLGIVQLTYFLTFL